MPGNIFNAPDHGDYDAVSQEKERQERAEFYRPWYKSKRPLDRSYAAGWDRTFGKRKRGKR